MPQAEGFELVLIDLCEVAEPSAPFVERALDRFEGGFRHRSDPPKRMAATVSAYGSASAKR